MNELTTQKLLETLHRAGMHVTHDQLKYWRRNGLLPKPHRRGKGRGKGIEQLWDKACVENVQLILESSANKRVNLAVAGRYLFAHNRPIGEFILRRCLREILVEMEEKNKRSTENAMSDSEFDRLACFLAPQAIRDAIEQTDNKVLIELYKRINKFETPFDAMIVQITNFQPVFDLLVETEFPDFTGRTSLSGDAQYRRQRSYLAWAVLIHHYGEALREMISNALHSIVTKSMSYDAGTPIVWPNS